MLEWLKRHAWKACDRHKRFRSSNLLLSALCKARRTLHGSAAFFAFTDFDVESLLQYGDARGRKKGLPGTVPSCFAPGDQEKSPPHGGIISGP